MNVPTRLEFDLYPYIIFRSIHCTLWQQILPCFPLARFYSLRGQLNQINQNLMDPTVTPAFARCQVNKCNVSDGKF